MKTQVSVERPEWARKAGFVGLVSFGLPSMLKSASWKKAMSLGAKTISQCASLRVRTCFGIDD